jgi:FlaG/FlaF family flagellin (archaellin)
MKRWLAKRPSAATVISLIALFVALGGTTYAATGQSWILGQSNSANAQTRLSAPIAARALQIINTGTGTGAGGIGISVAAGKPPIVVNVDAGKAPNLNADKLDGRDSTAFLAANGKAADADKVDGFDSSAFVRGGGFLLSQAISVPYAVQAPVLGIGSFFSVGIDCAGNFGDPQTKVSFTNLTSDSGNLFTEFATNPGFPSHQLLAAGDSRVVNVGGLNGVTFQFQANGGRMVTVWVYNLARSDDCHIQAMALAGP